MSGLNPQQFRGGIDAIVDAITPTIITIIQNTLSLNNNGNGITPAQHQLIRNLIHFIEEGPADGFSSGAFKEVIGQPFPTSIIWYSSVDKTSKIIEKTIIREGIMPITITWILYDIDGISITHTISDNITYSNNIFEVSRIRTIS